MSENNIHPTVIKRTQDTLGKYVKKPPLSEKLLKKPPFRFLFDVFSAVIKETGCFQGLYSSDELNIDSIKDRDDKMKFLQKMIDVVRITTNQPLTVRTSKIVAGQEPEKTNELLYLIGEIIEKNLDWNAAVKNINGVLSPSKEKNITKKKTESKDPKKEKEKSKDAKSTSKTVSPAAKLDKSKVKLSKEKNPNESKITKDVRVSDVKSKEKDKTTKKPKDKLDKTKVVKSKSVSKESTPSPIQRSQDSQFLKEKTIVSEKKLIESKDSQSRRKEELNSGNKPTDIIKEAEKSAQVKSELSEVSPIKDVDNFKTTLRERPSSRKTSVTSQILNEDHDKNTEIFIKSSTQKSSENLLQGTNDSPTESASRTSSANRRTSGRSRHSNDSKLRKDESENNDASLNHQIESLNSVNADVVNPAITNTSASATPAAMAVDQKPPTDVKRESTFTRENSKEIASNRPRTSLRPPSARPASARPGAPRRRDKNVEIILQPNDQVKMSGISVKLETFGDLDDDGENLVIIENTNVDEVLDMHAKKEDTINNNETLEQQGHLVQQILETQKELVHQSNDMIGKPEKDASSALSNRQSSARQMNNLRDVIQNLTKSVNPLGKLMDFIPEDIDAMQLELSMWRDSYTQSAIELKKERSLTESATEPMKNQLLQIEANLMEYQEMIAASRTKILQNSEKILKMLTE